MLLQKFPSFDPAWSDEIQGKWFEIFEELKTKGEKQWQSEKVIQRS